MFAPHELMTGAEVVTALNNAGCQITIDVYKALAVAVNTVPHQGHDDHEPELVIEGGRQKLVPRKIDKPYLQEHVDQQRLLRSSIERKWNLVHDRNQWVD